MPSVDVVDETFLAVPPEVVAAAFAAPSAWAAYWPDLILDVYLDRGAQGLRWTVAGALVGTMEVWLEPMLDGTLLHYFLRADLPGEPSPKRVRREVRRRQLAAKEVSLGLKTTLEGGRAPGVPPALP
ncbi:polyketide cyclase / dehydrase and lipid transport [Actinosynnema sp. CS-041913]|uniref:polyketide cyclase / dehydrase and lipid transport n=1 Tax=Actinosynnema sp. CS-041913 TaxID=3239917 RepID=UPI003D8E5788